MTRLLLIAGVLFLVAASTARASDPEFNAYAAMAEQWWGNGATPTCGEPSGLITAGGVVEAETQNLGSYADSNWGTCSIHVDQATWLWLSHARRCRVIFHEMGHLFGFGHIDGTIMQAMTYTGPFAICDDYAALHYPRHRAKVR